MADLEPGAGAAPLERIFPGKGEMVSLMRALDWSKTPVGPPETWPESLHTAVRICLTSSFPMWIWWGPEYTMFYNDAHRPMLGAAKHPHWLGRSAKGCWSEIWNDLLPMLAGARDRGEAAGFNDLLLILERNSIKEETYFTFSISPIFGSRGSVDGLICPTTETTRQVVSERRLRTLRDLGVGAGEAKSAAEACAVSAEILKRNPHDVAFALLYLTEPDGKTARLAGSVGLPPGPDAPEVVDLESPDPRSPWPLRDAAAGRRVLHLTDPRSSRPLPGGPWPEPCRNVLIVPLGKEGETGFPGFLVAGASPRRVLDQDYRSFFDLLAGHLATVVSNASALQVERRRAETLAELDRAKTAFFSNVSHEFRTPLTLMLGPLEDELAERSAPLPEARRERLETAHRNSLRLLKLVNSLLEFSRIEAGRVQATYEATDLAAYTAELAGVFRSAIEKAGLKLTVDCPPLPGPVTVDREMWEKIVLNLLSNAFKHTFEGGITVRLRGDAEHATLSVADTGVGIPAAERPRIFERFHRVKGAQSRTHEGTGIGLALVKELAGLHGGTVGLESQEGRGTTFTVSVKTGQSHLPADRVGKRTLESAAPHASAFALEALHWLPGTSSPTGAAPAVSGPRPYILLADDNADMRDYVRRLLVDQYEVHAVADGSAALASARARVPDLVLSDVMMPGLDGFGLLRELRADGATRTIPVILLSARAGEASAVEGLAGGADDYIAKPFSARELLARVRTHLELARVRRAWTLEVEQANKELEAFSYSVSHDLRSPLRAIDGYTQMLLEDHAGKLDPEGQRLLGVVLKSSHRMGLLIDDLLKFSRLGRTPLRLAAVDPNRLVQEVLEELLEAQPGRKIRSNIGTLPPAKGDAALLRQVFVNLLSNAMKYSGTREIADIEIGGTVGPGAVTYFVKDKGVGFRMEYAHKLFGVFQRLHSSDQFEGTGIGLALVQRIIHRHGGRVWAEGREGEGATFYFTLPSAEGKVNVET
jgi:signal transduction histidine kinase